MIITETFYVGDREFTRNYSDAGRYVVRDGVSYSEACDPAEYGRTYTEGDIMEEPEDGEGVVDGEYAEAGKILMGVES